MIEFCDQWSFIVCLLRNNKEKYFDHDYRKTFLRINIHLNLPLQNEYLQKVLIVYTQ